MTNSESSHCRSITFARYKWNEEVSGPDILVDEHSNDTFLPKHPTDGVGSCHRSRTSDRRHEAPAEKRAAGERSREAPVCRGTGGRHGGSHRGMKRPRAVCIMVACAQSAMLSIIFLACAPSTICFATPTGSGHEN